MNAWIKRILLLSSIGGGFMGFTLATVQLLQRGGNISYYVICSVALLIYLLGVYGGLRLVENETKGLRVLLGYFLAQVPIVVSPILSFQVSSGATIHATIGSAGLKGSAYLGSQWLLSFFNFNDHTFAIGVNFFAMWASWYLYVQSESRRQ